MICERHRIRKEILEEIEECNSCRIEHWLLELTEAITELRISLLECTTFVKESKTYKNWARLEAVDKSLKGFIEYAGPTIYRLNNKKPKHTGGID